MICADIKKNRSCISGSEQAWGGETEVALSARADLVCVCVLAKSTECNRLLSLSRVYAQESFARGKGPSFNGVCSTPFRVLDWVVCCYNGVE